jgi:hypothetical protein
MSGNSKLTFINQPICNEEYTFERFIEEHKKNPGKLYCVHSSSSRKNEAGIETTYYDLCFKFSDGKYYRANKAAFSNQLCSSAAKPAFVDAGKPVKFINLRFRELTREEIASGDYVMPDTTGLPEDEIENIRTRYNKSIDGFVAANGVLKSFHIVLDYEWKALNIRMKKGERDENGKEIMPVLLPASCIEGNIILSEIEKKENGLPVTIKLDIPRYTWKIPVMIPNKKTPIAAAKLYEKRLGTYYLTEGKFHPAVYSLVDSIEETKKKGTKVLVEAVLKGMKNGVPHEEPINCNNADKLLTGKSKVAGLLDVSKSSFSSKGHNLRITVNHLLVKRHLTNQKDVFISDSIFEEASSTNDGFAEKSDELIDFNEYDNDDEVKSKSSVDTSALDNTSVHFGSNNNPMQSQMQAHMQAQMQAFMQAQMQAQNSMQMPNPPSMQMPNPPNMQAQNSMQMPNPPSMQMPNPPNMQAQMPMLPNNQFYNAIMQNNPQPR